MAHLHKYVPVHNAGAEWMAHAILLDLKARGHDVFVTHAFDVAPYDFEGITVFRAEGQELNRVAREVDVVVTHLDRTRQAINAARSAGVPIVHLVHNDRQLAYHGVKTADDTLAVFNSEWIEAAAKWPGRGVLCRPHVDPARYLISGEHHRDAITLVNLTPAKGSAIFYTLARQLRARPFLGVLGAYGIQDVKRRAAPNLTIQNQTADIVGKAYAKTRLLLMPSSYESWGRVAVEAAVNGIPVIANRTPGLLESLGDAGIFPRKLEAGSWADAILRLDDPAVYADASAAVRARSLELAKITAGDLDRLAASIEELVGDHPHAYPVDVGILSSQRAGLKCPVCGAGSCSCKPTGEDIMAKAVRVIDRPPREERGEVIVYRTHAGDFRYDAAHARRLGLRSDGDTLGRPILKRLRIEARLDDVELELVTDRYADASTPARDAFLAALAITKPRALAGELGTLTALLKPGSRNGRATVPATTEDPDAPPEGRVGEILEWAGTNPDRLLAAHKAEKAGRARSSLLSELETRLEKV